jgi:GNAT superfamily N-acetyltransferase
MPSTTVHHGGPAVHRAGPEEAPAITEILSAAFMDDPISQWIFPDRTVRRRSHPDFFQIFVANALAEGQIYTTDEHTGAAIWLDVDPEVSESPEDHDRFLAAFDGAIDKPAVARFALLDELMSTNHPGETAHAYLPFIGVLPGAQGTGVGTALLRHRLAELDADDRPAYLEASSPRSGELYGRLGFAPIGATIAIPDGPAFHPMWRTPNAGCRDATNG